MLRSCLLLLLMAWSCTLPAQAFKKAFLHITSDDGLGLHSNHITALYQDKTGFLWVGTGNGLQRFDGAKFVTCNTLKPGSAALPQAQIRQLAGDSSGHIWVLLEYTPRIGIFDPQKLTYNEVPIRPRAALPPRAEMKLWVDSKGDVYLNVLRYGRMLRFDRARFEFNEQTPLNNLPAGWKCTLNVVEDTVTQRYWIVADSGLCVYDKHTQEMWYYARNPRRLPLLTPPQPYHVNSEFYIDKQRRYWFFYWTTRQEFRCYNEAGIPLKDTAGLTGVNTGYAELRKFCETAQGALWIYGPGCLYAQDKGAQKFSFHRNQYTDNFNIKYEDVHQVLEDRDGVVWIATDQGLYYHTPRRNQVENIYLSAVPGYYEVTDMLQLQTGEYFLSTWGKGIIVLDTAFRQTTTQLYNNAGIGNAAELALYKQVWAMHQHRSGMVLLGCQGGRLMLHHPAAQRTQFLNPPAFEARTIRFITEDKQGQVWFGTQAGTLICYDGKHFTIRHRLQESTIIYKLFVDRSNGWIWMATHERGLIAYDPKTDTIAAHYQHNHTNYPLYGDRVTDIEQLNDSTLYVAASGVLHIIHTRTGNVQMLTTAEGLPSNTATRLRLDSKGYLWIVTQQGLCHYDWRKNRFTSFGKKDGIFFGEAANQCDIIDKQGNMLFAGPNAMLVFNPAVFYNNPPPQPVVITDFKLMDTFLPVDSLRALRTIQLEPEANTFSIYFSVLNFRNRGQFTYYYKLEGADKDWVKADGLQLAQYRLLPPGKYTFKVKVENMDGLAAATITTLHLQVKPHFWRTGWFISLLAMVTAMIAYGMHRLRINKLLAVEKLRARLSRDLHDDMGSTLSTIHILSSMAKAKLHTDMVKTAEFIGKIGDNSQRMMEAMDDIVWAIKPDNDTMNRLIARMRAFATNVLEAKDIQVQFDADPHLDDLKPDMEYRRDLFLLFKEAVNNAAKYSKAAEVSIRLTTVRKKLVLQVEDNGIGFDVAMADAGNGLGNMKRRAAALGGQLHIQSMLHKGTTITLRAPFKH